MSSLQDWQTIVIAQHDAVRPFAPENGTPLKFSIGDVVTYVNEYGVSFQRQITGFYRPDPMDSMYANGRRYLLNSSCPWMPVRESALLST